MPTAVYAIKSPAAAPQPVYLSGQDDSSASSDALTHGGFGHRFDAPDDNAWVDEPPIVIVPKASAPDTPADADALQAASDPLLTWGDDDAAVPQANLLDASWFKPELPAPIPTGSLHDAQAEQPPIKRQRVE
jgi:hypothetical protein